MEPIISTDRPPMMEMVSKYFQIDIARTAFAYGDTIYKADGNVPPDLLAHEKVHLKQQADIGGPEIWWDKFLNDAEFRLSQEIPAYQVQYKWWRRRCDKAEIKRIRNIMAEDLSGATYGNMISFAEAYKIIAR